MLRGRLLAGVISSDVEIIASYMSSSWINDRVPLATVPGEFWVSNETWTILQGTEDRTSRFDPTLLFLLLSISIAVGSRISSCSDCGQSFTVTLPQPPSGGSHIGVEEEMIDHMCWGVGAPF
ncbi:hypothetical protein R1flu_010333 [Riccia fluitans]|uniref:Uncharacterized protein n=1 Tax=Riccia fluitans TaxID=41844 RepID=A0ABD1Z4P1_9MARC